MEKKKEKKEMKEKRKEKEDKKGKRKRKPSVARSEPHACVLWVIDS